MAISDDVLQLIDILQHEGFGVLAGELLTEISLGREIEKRPVPARDTASIEAEDVDSVLVRQPFEEDEQFFEAMRILRIRLVEPVRAFAEAEQIAGGLMKGKNVRIGFVDPEERFETAPLSRSAGDDQLVYALDELLERLPQMRSSGLTI
ncbi:hypothetical protein [Caulobacter sp. BE254]|uniref:hypothetical protein n=1 Tax=Caulobacter sp. BE254 TaxID=2817720 RepID=UPI00285F0355|nr:hypothetical protein [Caulobacter sp. BE254]MDR7115634.1 hypothetical protein [Caulobacter sp. BE254]